MLDRRSEREVLDGTRSLRATITKKKCPTRSNQPSNFVVTVAFAPRISAVSVLP